MGFAQYKNRISAYHDSDFCYDHYEYKDISRGAAHQNHEAFEIMFIKKGDIIYAVEGKNYRIKPGSFIVTRPGTWHTLIFEDRTVYERYDILFNKKLFSPQIQERLSSLQDVTDTENHPVVEELFMKMDYYFKYFQGEDLRNILCHLTEEIIYNIILMDKFFSKDEEETRYSANPTVIEALRYIEKNIGHPFSLDDLCGELFITKSHLHRLFSEHLQVTPKKYINSKRLLKAQRLLRRGGKPVQIYRECGFTEYSTFWRDYKKYFGYSPSEETEKITVRRIEF